MDRFCEVIYDQDVIRTLAYSLCGKFLLSGGANKVRLWNISKMRTIDEYSSNHNIRCVRFAPDGNGFAYMNRDGEFVHYDKEGHRYPQKFLSTVSNFEFVKNSNNIITGSINSNVVYSNIQTKVNSILYPHSGGEVCCLAISPNGKYIASSAIGDNSILLYDLEENKKLPPLDGHKNTIKALAFSPDSNLLGSGDNGAMLFYWDMTKRGKEAFKLSFQWSGNEINDVIFHPFHFIFAATGADHRVKLFDMGNNNKKLEDLLGHGKYINSIAFSPDGKFLASGSQDHTIRIWNIKKPNHVA